MGSRKGSSSFPLSSVRKTQMLLGLTGAKVAGGGVAVGEAEEIGKCQVLEESLVQTSEPVFIPSLQEASREP